MRERWAALSDREKQTVRWGAIALGIILGYLFCWMPLHESVMASRESLLSNRSLLVWMQQTDHQMSSLTSASSRKGSASDSLLMQVQASARENGLTSLSSFQPLDDNTVQISGPEVEFDRLISWLINQWADQGLAVSQALVTSTDMPGIVSASITLKY